MKSATLRERLRYQFDSFISKGGGSIFVSLVVVFLVLFAFLAGLRGLSMLVEPKGVSHETHDSFLGQTYIIFLELTDPGNMNQDKFSSPLYKISGVLAGLAGVIILSMLIAFITTALDQKLLQPCPAARIFCKVFMAPPCISTPSRPSISTMMTA